MRTPIRSIKVAALLCSLTLFSASQSVAQDRAPGEEIEPIEQRLEREALEKILSKEGQKDRNATQSAAVNEADSLALIALYNATDGPSWTDNENWTTGEVATWKGITVVGDRVTQVILSYNGLNGALPAEIADLTALTHLTLNGANLGQDSTLEVPDFLYELPELTLLSLSGNSFVGTLSEKIATAPKLQYLTLSSNDIGGDIPASIASSSTITQFWVSSNELTGSIPQDFQNMSQLTTLFLSNNNLSGEFPAWMSSMTQLAQLFISRNEFTGSIPSEFGNLVNLFSLGIGGGNLMTGEIPDELSQLTNLSSLQLENMSLTAEFPTWISSMTRLISLNLRNIGISGELPLDIGNLTNLRTLIIDGLSNGLTGPIPPSIGDLSNLTLLWASGNAFSGEIPKELGQLDKLNRLDIQGSNLTGSLPPELGNMVAMEWMSLRDNNLYSEIPAEWANMTNAKMIRLDRNRIWGIVPIEFATRGAEMDTQRSFELGCNLTSNHTSLCIPNTGDYATLGVTNICGIDLQATCPVTAVSNETDTLPEEISLNQNYPNPFNPSTSIGYQLSSSSDVSFAVTNELGQKVMEFDLGRMAAGQHQFELDMHDLPSGLYFYTLATDHGQMSKRMNLIK